MMNHYIYLSGTAYELEPHASWKKELIHSFNNYEEFKKEHCITFIDPILFDTDNPGIVNMDLNNIKLCDIVVFYIHDVTIGTMMELTWCLTGFPDVNKKKLYLITDEESIAGHPWIKCATNNKLSPFRRPLTLCKSTKDAVEKIIAGM